MYSALYQPPSRLRDSNDHRPLGVGLSRVLNLPPRSRRISPDSSPSKNRTRSASSMVLGVGIRSGRSMRSGWSSYSSAAARTRRSRKRCWRCIVAPTRSPGGDSRCSACECYGVASDGVLPDRCTSASLPSASSHLGPWVGGGVQFAVLLRSRPVYDTGRAERARPPCLLSVWGCLWTERFRTSCWSGSTPTGDNRRWSERSAIWREGWRNLHHPFPTEVSAELVVEGVRGRTMVRRWWPQGAELEQSLTEVQPHGRSKTDLLSLGWEQDLVAFRPFLSYNELGSML